MNSSFVIVVAVVDYWPLRYRLTTTATMCILSNAYEYSKVSFEEYYFKVYRWNEDDQHLCGIIDLLGNQITPCIYSSIRLTNKKYYIVESNKLFGVIDLTGAAIIPFIYDEISDEYNDMFIVKRNNKYGVIDSHNKTIIPMIYQKVFFDTEDIFMVKEDDNTAFYVDKNNNKTTNNYNIWGIVLFKEDTTMFIKI